MASQLICPKCGEQVPPNTAHRLCARCVLEQALALSNTVAASTRDHPENGAIQSPDDAGPRFGAYRTIRLLGSGGMGAVYLAEQEHPIRRLVALKVIKPGMASSEVIARFETERQSLALMDHPHIARVYDAGSTPDGRPYFVMEYVDGVAITRYCDDRQLSNRKRMEVFRQVCLAVHHAHQKGVIHRDIKPSNVMVTEQDRQPVPKVIDFGVAKAIRQHQEQEEAFTRHGFMVGTPEYMSPEQAEMGEHGIDTATDIYSLGVLLYELLVGVLPFDAHDLRKKGYQEILRIIREDQPPPPSTRLRGLGETASGIAERRSTDLGGLRRQLRGDLEWITLRAMEKDKLRRYSSAAEFASDIARHLNDEAVLASPPGAAYRLTKLVRRNKVGAAAMCAVAASLVLGMAATTMQYYRAEEQRTLAESSASSARHQTQIAMQNRELAERERKSAIAAREEAVGQQRAAKEENYRANIAAADLLIRSADYGEAKRRLFLCPPELRGWEWRYLFAQSDTTLKRMYAKETPVEDVSRFAFSKDGSRLYWNLGYGIESWDVVTLSALHAQRSLSHAISGDASVFLTFYGHPVTNVLGPRGPEHALGIAPVFLARMEGASAVGIPSRCVLSWAGETAACGYHDGRILVWDTASGRLTRSLKREEQFGSSALSLSPDATRLVYAVGSVASVVDLATGTEVTRLPMHADWISVIEFGYGGNWLATGSVDNTVRLYDRSFQLSRTLMGHQSEVLAIAFPRDGSMVATASKDRTVRLWNATNGRPVATLAGAEEGARALAFTPDGQRIIAGTPGGQMMVWDVPTAGGTLLRWSALGPADLSRDGKTLVLRGSWIDTAKSETPKFGVLTLDARTGDVAARWEWSGRRTNCMALSPDKRRIAICDGVGGLELVDTHTGSNRIDLEGHTDQVESVVYSDDGQQVVSGGLDGTVRFWNVSSGRPIQVIQLSGPVGKVEFSPDGFTLATTSARPDGVGVQIWNATDRRIVRELRCPEGASTFYTVAFSADSKRLATSNCAVDSKVRIWDIQSGGLAGELEGHGRAQYAHGLAFSPDGRMIASEGTDLTLRVWDLATFRLLLTQPGLGGRSRSHLLRFTPDGTRIIGHSQAGFARVWSNESGHPAAGEELAERLRREHVLWSDVRHRLQMDASLAAHARAEALALLRDRPDSARDLNEIVHQPLISPSHPASFYRLALRRAEDQRRLMPRDTMVRDTVALARYRTGNYARVIQELDDTVPGPDTWTIIALTHFRLGRHDKARESLVRAREMQKIGVAAYRNPLIAEAEKLISSKGPQ